MNTLNLINTTILTRARRINFFYILVVIDVGFGYVNSFDALDNRLATLDKMVTKEYRNILGEKKIKSWKIHKIILLHNY